MLTCLVLHEPLVNGTSIVLESAEAHHLQVRRVKAGERVRVVDGRGGVGVGPIRVVKQQVTVDVDTLDHVAAPPALALAVGAGDRDRFGWMVEKVAELGATAIVPLETEWTAGVASKLRGPYLDKLRRRALEAIKQCGSAWAPEIEAPTGLREFIARPVVGRRWLADAAGEPPPAVLNGSPVTAVIGPEGGLTPVERELLSAAGYLPITVGAHTLRFETAAIAAAVAIGTARERGTRG